MVLGADETLELAEVDDGDKALELVADRGAGAPFDPQRHVHARLKMQAMANGLMCYPMGGTVDGVQGDHMLLAPPFIIDAAHIETIVERLSAAISDTLVQLPTPSKHSPS